MLICLLVYLSMVKAYLQTLKNLLFPKTCLACCRPLDNNSGAVICPECAQAIKKNLPPLCDLCGRQIRQRQIYKRVCPVCQRVNFFFDRALAPCIYEGVIRKLIHKFKYQNREHLDAFLAGLLVDFIRQNRGMLNFCDLVMPIPLHKARLREREFNQAELLACFVAEELRLPLSAANLWRRRFRRPQAELKPVLRRKNISGCFALREPKEVKGKKIILVDDVLTSGATCSEAAGELKKAGALCVWVLTLAS